MVRAATILLLVLGTGCERDNRWPILHEVLPQTGYVGSRLEIKLTASDEDYDRLKFSFKAPPLEKLENRARIYQLGSGALFTWTPIASDAGVHQFDFSASDGVSTSTIPVRIEIKPSTKGDSTPIFRKPLNDGMTLEMAKHRCVEVEVVIEDPDSVDVSISLGSPAVRGAKLNKQGPREALVSWCPDEAQVAKAVHVLHLVADDHDNPPVHKGFTILLHAELPEGCPGSPPSIVHKAPQSSASPEPIMLRARVTDDKGLKSPPVVYFTSTKPANPAKLDLSKMNQITMVTTSATATFEAELPSSMGTPGQSTTIYYVIVAEDNDDPSGNCDHRTQLPEDHLLQVMVTKPADNTCVPTDVDGDKLFWDQGTCPADHFCPIHGPGASLSYCAKTCKADTDCNGGEACKVFERKQGCGKAGPKEVGGDCKDFTECAGKLMCLPWNGGYCTISDCSTFGGYAGECPVGAACVPLPDKRFDAGMHWVCLQLCQSDGNCRATDGYSCKEVIDDTYASRKVCL